MHVTAGTQLALQCHDFHVVILKKYWPVVHKGTALMNQGCVMFQIQLQRDNLEITGMKKHYFSATI